MTTNEWTIVDENAYVNAPLVLSESSFKQFRTYITSSQTLTQGTASILGTKKLPRLPRK